MPQDLPATGYCSKDMVSPYPSLDLFTGKEPKIHFLKSGIDRRNRLELITVKVIFKIRMPGFRAEWPGEKRLIGDLALLPS
jgi:hypothetical protein